ncbi:PX domain-containing protein [Gaeumannomyces tritici R3-111a-1]|uniref:PX domain-containing protein n=1 Tax=Gaeumannomyces tritici (strain R3-111a-1) TaxID=644352 RepID=J3NHA4_GAET3|nr:PX domain-containing protein [Gaeumannomyces tritici R3-111a-1]EJT80647.1 PX domain-containing protein [Gaeumannomyces tritici R3-111a-1]
MKPDSSTATAIEAIDKAPDVTVPEIPTLAPPVTPTSPLEAVETAEKPQHKTGSDPRHDDGSSSDSITNKTIQFLSTATPETLGTIAVGLAATTYFVLGSLGILLIGAFAGAAGVISWEARSPEVARNVRGEKGVDALTRILDYKGALSVAAEADGKDGEDAAPFRGFEDFQPETRDALNGLVDAVIRDYVNWWYAPLVPSDKAFALSCRKVLTSFLLSVSNRLSKKRPADTFLDFLTNSSSIVIVFFSELATALADMPADGSRTAADSIYNYLAANPDSNLANLLNKKQQAAKLRMVAEDLLGFLDRPTYDCDPARTFLREILAGVALESTLTSCSKAEWINGWIVHLLEAGEPDFNQAIDVGMQTGSDPSTFADLDGNVGNIGLTKGNRNSLDMEKARRKESMAHKKKLSKADEEMEALEEMRKLNQMIADEDSRRKRESMAAVQPPPRPQAESASATEASSRLADALKRNVDTLDMQPDTAQGLANPQSPEPPSATSQGPASPKDAFREDASSKRGSVHTPLTPGSSAMDTPSSQPSSPRRPDSGGQFTSFDQLVPPAQDDVELSDSEQLNKGPPPLTLHNAVISIHDDGMPDSKNWIKTKPSSDFLIQVEPATSHYPGWMIVRKYSDFESLHEVLARIAKISSATAFTEQHNTLPSWKQHTKSSLRGELERYCRDACWYKPLAESEGMKRFLEKNTTHVRGPSKTGFEAFESMSKNVLGVLTSAPKGVAEGGKVVVGGVTGVLGNIGLGSRKNTSTSLQDTAATVTPSGTSSNRLSLSLSLSSPKLETSLSPGSLPLRKRDSMDSQRSSVISTQPSKVAPMERRPSFDADGGPLSSREHSRAPSLAPSRDPIRSPSSTSLSGMKLPPPPNDMPDDYECAAGVKPLQPIDGGASPSPMNPSPPSGGGSGLSRKPSARKPQQFAPLSEQETGVAVELVFAIITELYTLSSAWNFRRTLLGAAKSYLLRPGNPFLASIRSMIQCSVLDGAGTDAGVAAQLRRLRENALPTPDELAAWPAEPSAEEKERLRTSARRLLIQSGVPAALSGVMGQSATADALGRVFDCLQAEEVARGLLFGIVLQAVRVITH